MDELQARVNATTTVAIKNSYPQGCLGEDTLSTIEKRPSGTTELEENSCKVRGTPNQKTRYYFNLPPAAIH